MGDDPNKGDAIGEAARKEAGRLIAQRREEAKAAAKAKADDENRAKFEEWNRLRLARWSSMADDDD